MCELLATPSACPLLWRSRSRSVRRASAFCKVAGVWRSTKCSPRLASPIAVARDRLVVADLRPLRATAMQIW